MNLMQDKKPSSFLEKFLRCVYQNSIPVFVYKCAQLMKQKIEVRPMVQWWLTPSLFRASNNNFCGRMACLLAGLEIKLFALLPWS